jgi:hypothetical protein
MRAPLGGHQAVNDNPRSPSSARPLETGLSCAPSGGSSFGRRSVWTDRTRVWESHFPRVECGTARLALRVDRHVLAGPAKVR